MQDPFAPATTPVAVWDLPIRLFHWLLVGLVAACWATGEFGKLDLHMTLGTAALALLLFRLAWGVAGSATARFAGFVKGPGAILAYLRQSRSGHPPPVLGHNPLGACSVLALLALLILQGVTGLFTNDDVLTEGPLVHLVSGKASALLSTLHRAGFKLLLALIGLHVAAVLFYLLVKKDNLIRPMVTGTRPMPAGVAGVRFASPWLALVLAAASAAAVWGGLWLLATPSGY